MSRPTRLGRCFAPHSANARWRSFWAGRFRLLATLAIAGTVAAGSMDAALAQGFSDNGGYYSGLSTLDGPEPPRETPAATSVATGLVLREGTRIGPLTGRFVRSGQRWRFLPDAHDGLATGGGNTATQSTGRITSITELEVDGTAVRRVTREDSRRLAQQRAAPIHGSSIASSAVGDSLSRLGGTGQQETRRVSDGLSRQALERILVIENLMLERVARAIDEDSSELHWTITGMVTEFRDENRLLLTTVQRAPTPDP